MTDPSSDCQQNEGELRQLVNRAFDRYMAMTGKDTLSDFDREAAVARLIQDVNHTLVWETDRERVAMECELCLADYHLRHTETVLRQLVIMLRRIANRYPGRFDSPAVGSLMDAVDAAEGWLQSRTPPEAETTETPETRNSVAGAEGEAQADDAGTPGTHLKIERVRGQVPTVLDVIECLRMCVASDPRAFAERGILEALKGLTQEQRSAVDAVLSRAFRDGVSEGRAREKYGEAD